MEPLIPTILIRPPRLDQHRDHIEPHQPDAQPRQPAEPIGPNGGPPSLSVNRGTPNARNATSSFSRTSTIFGRTIAGQTNDAWLHTSLTVSGITSSAVADTEPTFEVAW